MRIKHFSLLFMALAAACTDGRDAELTEQSSDWSHAAVARYAGGAITMAEVVSQAARDRQSGRALPQCASDAAGLDDTVACYRETARDLALGRLLQARGLGTTEAEDRLAAQRAGLSGRMHLQHLGDGVEISEEAVRARFEADADNYTQPTSVLLWNILRRHEDPSRPELTLALLRELRQRVLAGEPFAELAREFSQSETRLRGGLVGRVAQGGRLAPQLEHAAFALEPGDVSEPIAVPGGAVLLQVSEKTAAVTYPFADVRVSIESQLREERVLEVASEMVNTLEPPPGSVILAEEALFAALAANGEDVLLQVGGSRLMASEMGLGPGADLSDPELRSAVLESYQGRVRLALLAVLVERSDEAWAAKIREDVNAQFEALRPLLIIENWVKQSMEELLKREPARLESYFKDNRAHYQTPFRFDIVGLELPLADAPHERLQILEQLAGTEISGGDPLDGIATDLGGEVTDHGWVDFESLPTLFPGKGVSLINQTEVGQLVPPYQHDDALHLLWIRGREEPRLQEFDAVRERVRGDYMQRFGKQLSAELREEFLAEAGFEFDAAAVRRLLSD